jgi:hypothetical protein
MKHRLRILAVVVLALALPATARAETPGRGWQITSTTLPTHIGPGGDGFLVLQPIDVGALASSGGAGAITVTDELPAGVSATEAGEIAGWGGKTLGESGVIGHSYWSCAIAAGGSANSIVTCHNTALLPSISGGGGVNTPLSVAGIGHQPAIGIAVEAAPAAAEGTFENRTSISGGGATGAAVGADPLTIASGPAGFGLGDWEGWFSNADGTLDTQAGSVPYEAVFDFDLANLLEEAAGSEAVLASAGAEPRNVLVSLPPGLVGNPTAVPTCPRQEFNESSFNSCPLESQVGNIRVNTGPNLTLTFKVFNVAAPPGKPAELGFRFENISTFIDAGLRSGSDYGIDTEVRNAPQKIVLGAELVLWGVPGDPTHNLWRNVQAGGCNAAELEPGGRCNLGPQPTLKPFLRLPTSCAAPPGISISISGWSRAHETVTAPLAFFSHDAEGTPVGLDGCNRLPFEPTISAKPTTNVADAPTGLEFDLHVPQPEGVAPIEAGGVTTDAEPELHEADLKDAIVTLPQGIAVNPASGNGLAACTPAQIGLTSTPGVTPITMTPDPANCPDAAKIGTVEVETPLLSEHDEAGEPTSPHPLQGAVYVASPEQNPFGSLLAIYIAVNDKSTGTVLKLAGKVEADPVTGQLTTTFPEAPQLPFSDFHLTFFKGAAAALRTPQTCGSYAITSDMTPWGSPEGADVHPADSFAISQSPVGGSCPTSAAGLPSSSAVEAGTLAPKAGAYSPFVLHIARADGSQELTRIETTLPEGLLAKLAGVSDCPEAAIAQAEGRNRIGEGRLEQEHPSCPASSEVGPVRVGAGAGPAPYYVSGHAYLAGPYKGAPLSLVIVTPAVAGPYDLGDVVVRTALQVDPLTAQVHAVSDEFPHILQGIPLDVRSIDLELARPDFTLNPTSCAKKSITGSISALEGGASSLQLPFQVGECKALRFAPKLQLILKGSTRHAGHPALRAVLTYPKGSYANIARAQVNLPHSEFIDQGNLNKTCTRPVLLASACPASTVYGTARAWTPLLEAPVEGPVFLVGGFGYKLPALVAELDGRIRVLLVGKVDSGPNKGIRNTFEAVPDAPVERFELSLKGGPKYSLLENSENLCARPQKAIADFTAQNGLVDNSKVPLQVRCPKGGKGKKGKGGRHKGGKGRHR